MTWLWYALFALITFSVYDLLSRYLGVRSQNPRAFSGIYNVVATLITPVLLLAEPFKKPEISPIIILLTVLGLSVWALFGRFEYFAHKHVEASTLSIIIKLGPVITFLLSVLLLGEAFTLAKVSGLVLILLASFLVIGWPNAKMLKDKGLGYGLLITILLGIGWTFDKVLTPRYGVVLFATMTFLSPAIVSTFIPPLPWSALKKELVRGSWKMVLLAFINVLGYGAMIKALTLADASKVMPIATSTTPLVVLFAALFLGERKNLVRKVLATLLIVPAVYFMR